MSSTQQIAIYCRVSSEEQRDRGTIENQIEFATKYCDLHKLEISGWYKDDGITGTLPLEERPEGYRLLQDARAKKIDIVLIYKLDRLGRATRIILNAVHSLEDLGVKIKSMTEPFDTSDPSGRFLLTILAGVADLERENILARSQQGINRAVRIGKWVNGIPPYGYKVDADGYLNINTDKIEGFNVSEVDVIRLIYDRITSGQSCGVIADYLNAAGIPPAYARGKRLVKKTLTRGIWRPSRILTLLKNTTYMGIHTYGKRSKTDRELVSREVPSIIEEDQWNDAQKKLKDNQSKAKRNSKKEYLLSGLAKCNICGCTYSGVSYPDGKDYYICRGKKHLNGKLLGKCASKNMPKTWVEDFVWNDCVKFVNNPADTITQINKKLSERQSQKDNLQNELSALLKTINEKEEEKQSMLDLFRKKIISQSDIEVQFDKINAEKEAIQKRIDELKNLIENEDTDFSSAEELLRVMREKMKKSDEFEVRKDIVRNLVERVIMITQGEQVSVQVIYKFIDLINHTPQRIKEASIHGNC